MGIYKNELLGVILQQSAVIVFATKMSPSQIGLSGFCGLPTGHMQNTLRSLLFSTVRLLDVVYLSREQSLWLRIQYQER